MMKIAVALRLYGPQLDPSTVTAALGVRPTEQHVVGDPHTGHEGRMYDAFSSGLWSLDSDLPDTASLSEQVLKILDRVKAAKLTDLRQTEIQVDLFAGVFSDGEPCSLLLTPEAARKIGQLGIPLDIAIYP